MDTTWETFVSFRSPWIISDHPCFPSFSPCSFSLSPPVVVFSLSSPEFVLNFPSVSLPLPVVIDLTRSISVSRHCFSLSLVFRISFVLYRRSLFGISFSFPIKETNVDSISGSPNNVQVSPTSIVPAVPSSCADQDQQWPSFPAYVSRGQ